MSKILKILMFILLLGILGCREQIVHDLTENDANRLVARLNQAQIHGTKTKQADGRWSIAVDKELAIKALEFISNSRLIRSESDEASSKSSLISSREDQRFKYERALSSSIENTLSSLEDVLEARVHLNLPPTDPLFGQPLNNAKGTASVLLISKASFSLSNEQIASLVSGASGIESGAISVLVSKGDPNLENAQQANVPNTKVVMQGQSVNRTVLGIGLLIVVAIILCGMLAYKKLHGPIDASKLNEKFKVAA